MYSENLKLSSFLLIRIWLQRDEQDERSKLFFWVFSSCFAEKLHPFSIFIYSILSIARVYVNCMQMSTVENTRHWQRKSMIYFDIYLFFPTILGSLWYKFTPIPSCHSVFVYMIPAQNLILSREVTPAQVHPVSLYGSEISIPVQELILISCKGSTTLHSSMKSVFWQPGMSSA